MEKKKNIFTIVMMAGFLFGFSFFCWFGEKNEYSVMERRYLKQFPQLTKESVLSGRFMADFESYSQDNFPARDAFRGIKSASALFVFGQAANNKLYLADGHIGKLEYPYNKESIDYASSAFQSIYNRYLKDTDCKVYYSIIPDKGYFLAGTNGYPSIDYDALKEDFCMGMDNMTYIDLFDVVTLEDFYTTDTHWRQEEITDVAVVLANAMGKELTAEYEIRYLEKPFYGVYYGQLALPVQGETLSYLDHEIFAQCYVYDYTDMHEIAIYDMEKAEGPDLYEIFLSGPLSLVTIENPNADTEDELILFRDSFGSSIAPLFVEKYKKITLVDIRYLHSAYLGNYITFEDQDVLFLYSTMVLNHSETLKWK